MIYKKWWFWLIILLILVGLATFFYPKKCGGLINKEPTWENCSCLGFLGEKCLHMDKGICIDSAPTTVCYGICLKNTCISRTTKP